MLTAALLIRTSIFPKWSSAICGGHKRGICAKIQYANERIPEVFKYDDRVEWPRRFFHSVCHCKDNFFGIACEECYYGWEGHNCDKRKIIIRRNIKDLSPRDKYIVKSVIDRSLYVPSGYSVFIDQLNKNNDPLTRSTKWLPAPIQYMLVFIHRFGSRATLFEDYLDCQNFGLLNFNHEAIGFITWHRFYMMLWERLLQNIAKKEFGIHDFALPYWDWTDQTSCDICTDDMAGAPGIRGEDGVRISLRSPFGNWTEYCVEPDNADESPCYGCHVAGTYGVITREWNSLDFPTSADVEFVLSKRRFHVQGERVTDTACNSFHRALEGMCGQPSKASDLFFMHNKIHNMIDGSMCCSGSAPSDPLFIFHHTQIDRIFEEYINRYKPTLDEFPNTNARPGHSRFSFLTSFLPLITHAQMFKPSKALGYVYDSFNFGTMTSDRGPNKNREENNIRNSRKEK